MCIFLDLKVQNHLIVLDNRDLKLEAKGGAVFMAQINENTIRNCTFSDHIAKEGGAIHIDRSVNQIRFDRIYIEDCVFVANKAVSWKFEWSTMGGAVFLGPDGVAIINRCTFKNNELMNTPDPTSAWGGAIYASGSEIRMSGCIFYNNTASAMGGAVYIGATGHISITTSLFLSNRAETGGAVYTEKPWRVDKQSLTIVNVRFINNSAIYGGAVRIEGSGVKIIRNCIFVNNTAATIGQSVLANCAITLNNTYFEAFESTNTFHLHSEAASGVTSITNTTLHLHRNEISRGMKSNALYISSPLIKVFSSLKVKCPKGFNVGERNSSFRWSASRIKKFTFLELY